MINNIATTVEQMATQQPDAINIRYPYKRAWDGKLKYQSLTYGELLNQSEAIAKGLGYVGVTRGMRAVLMIKPSLDFFALAFALIRAGIIPVIVDPGMGIKNLKVCLAEAEPQVFIGIPTAHLARVFLGWGKATLQTLITVGSPFFWGGYTLDEIKRLGADRQAFQTVETASDETAAIIFTSGSTGVPKGVIHTHGNLVALMESLRDTFDFNSWMTDLPTFPAFALIDPVPGKTTVIPKMDFTKPAQVNPKNIIQAIHEFSVDNMFGSPALLNRVGRYGVEHGVQFPTLKRVLSAGAPVPAPVLERYAKLLPDDANIYTVYGATETLLVATITHHEILGETAAKTNQGAGVCVGYPVKGIDIQIIQITDEPIPTWNDSLILPQGEIGEIAVKGGHVTCAYFNREQSTQLAKIQASDGFYHRMGDLGYLDEQGRLWFCGRKAHRVITDDGTLFTVPIESVYNTHPDVFRTALVGVNRQPVLCVELEATARHKDKAQIKRELLEIGAELPIQTILFHKSFPVDIRHNSKIFREKLALWAAQQLA